MGPASSADMGSVGIGFEVDLKSLRSQLNQSERLVTSLQDRINSVGKRAATQNNAGFLGSIVSGGKKANQSLSTLAGSGGMLGNITSGLSDLGSAFGGVGSAAKLGGGALLAFAGTATGIVVAVAAALSVVKALQFGFAQLRSAIQLAVGHQAVETSFKVLAQNMGISSEEADNFRKSLERYNIAGASATKIMQNLLNAQLPLDDSTKSLIDVAQRYAVIAGTDTPTAINTITTAISTLNPELLRQFGIVQTLPQIYDAYANKLGVSADALSTVQQRQAILNNVISSGTRLQGVQNAAQFDSARGMQILKSNIDNFKAALGRVALPTFTGLLQVLIPISRQLGGDTTNLSQKMDILGQRLASVVVPAFQRFISFVKSIPWTQIIDGAYRFMQVLKLQASVWGFITKQSIIASQAMAGVVGAMIMQVSRLIAVFRSAANVAAVAWKVITGQADMDDLSSAMQSFGTSVKKAAVDPIVSLGKALGNSFTNTIDNAGDSLIGMAKATQNFVRGFNIEDFFKGLPAGSHEAWNAALSDAEEGTGNLSAKARKALRKLQEDLAKENTEFARGQAKSAKDFETNLSELVAQHRDQIHSITQDINKETNAYEKANQQRQSDYKAQLDELAKADSERKNDVQKQLSEEVAKGRFADQTKIASLKARLQFEDAENKKAVDEAKKRYEAETTNAKGEHDERLTNLQDTLNKELAIQAKYGDDFTRLRDFQIADDITKLKESHAEQLAEEARSHAERIQDIIKRGAEETAQYAANGAGNANAYAGALVSGINDNMPAIQNTADLLGQETMNKAAAGMQTKKDAVGFSVKDVLTNAAAGAGIGAIFGPVGAGIGAIIGAGIGATGGSILGSLRNMFNTIIAQGGGLNDFGKKLVGLLGKALSDALGTFSGPFKTAWSKVGLPAFATGGIVSGQSGRDNVVARVSAGEMILNKDQQGRLFNMLNGSSTPQLGGTQSGIKIDTINISLPSVKNSSDFARELQLKFATMRTN